MFDGSALAGFSSSASPQEPLLSTKFHIPKTHPHHVARPRLIARLNEGLECKLILISAPVGFGKTTLLSEWINLSAFKHPVAWLSLDERDNDPVRFYKYVVAALSSLAADNFNNSLLTTDSAQSSFGDLLTALINTIAADMPFDFVFVIDDYHVITSQPVNHALAYILNHMPPQMHLIISTRIDPQMPLAQLRARGQLLELRSSDLRFTINEEIDFLDHIMGVNLCAEEISELDSRIEGWIAGLQLAALSLRDQEDTLSFIQSFTGSHRYIGDYLADQVLVQQPPDIQSFLLQTSILERFTSSLCDSVTGQGESPLILGQLETCNLFIIPLDDERRWYRYHHLFADLLETRLEESHPELVTILHSRAAEWFEQNGFLTEAVNHALKGEDNNRSLRLILQNAFPMLMRGEDITLSAWINCLPSDYLTHQPWLLIYDAWAMVAMGHVNRAERRIQEAEKILDNCSPEGEKSECILIEQADRQSMLSYTAYLHSRLANLSADVSSALQYARQAKVLLPKNDVVMGCIIAYHLGSIYYNKNDLENAGKAFADAVELGKAADNIYVIGRSLSALAKLRKLQGRLHDAYLLYNHAAQIGNERSCPQFHIRGNIYIGFGDLLCEWNDLETASRYLKEGIECAKRWVNPSALAYGYASLARVLLAKGEMEEASATLKLAQHLLETHKVYPEMTSIVRAAWVRFWLAMNDWSAIQHWLRKQKIHERATLGFINELDYMSSARVCIAQGNSDRALELLDDLVKVVEAGGRVGRLIEILTLKALAFQGTGKISSAFTALENALTLAEPEGYARIFLDEGSPMAELLLRGFEYRTWRDPRLTAFVKLLLSDFGLQPIEKSSAFGSLSMREKEVLQLVAGGASNKEIAQSLSVTVSTVKAHLRNINAKLEVNSRTQAVARARSLHMIY